MVKFFNNRDLSNKFDVNLARWKRWAREFLPSDPLAGQQAGYARQYYIDDVFTVFLGGCLVSDLGFSIREARKILEDTRGWMKSRGFHFDPHGHRAPAREPDFEVESYALIFQKTADGRQMITARGTLVREVCLYKGVAAIRKIYVDQPIRGAAQPGGRGQAAGDRKILLISGVLEKFQAALNI